MSDPRNAPGFLRPAQYHRRLYHIRSSGGQSARSGVMSAHDDGPFLLSLWARLERYRIGLASETDPQDAASSASSAASHSASAVAASFLMAASRAFAAAISPLRVGT
jgi:hypothetical protein